MAACETDLINEIGEGLITSIEACVTEAGLDSIRRSHFAMGPIPAEDCCPDIAVWSSNIRFFDGSAPDTLTENRIVDHYGVAFDLNVRVGLPYLESDEDGQPLDSSILHGWTQDIHQYVWASYVEGISKFSAFIQTYQAEKECLVSLHPQPADPFNLGGCAGFQFIITVSVV